MNWYIHACSFIGLPMAFDNILVHSNLVERNPTQQHCWKLLGHDFLKALVTLNKMEHRFWHYFRCSLLCSFLVWFILSGAWTWITIKLMFLISWWRIPINDEVVSEPNHWNQTDHTLRKSMKNCAKKGFWNCVPFFFWGQLCLRKDVRLFCMKRNVPSRKVQLDSHRRSRICYTCLHESSEIEID